MTRPLIESMRSSRLERTSHGLAYGFPQRLPSFRSAGVLLRSAPRRRSDGGLYDGRMAGEAASMSIGEAANRTGLSPYTLRYYEREGLLAGPVPRSESGHRVYAEAHIEWLMMCKALRASGMPLRAIARFVDLVKAGPGTEAKRLTLLRDHQHRLTAEIAELSNRLAHISSKIGLYEGRPAQEDVAAACLDRPNEDA